MIDDDENVTGGLLEAVGNIQLTIGNISEEMKRQRRLTEQQRLAAIRNYVPLSGQTTLDASGGGIVDFGTPQDGRVWVIRQVGSSVQGSENVTPTAAAVVTWYIGSLLPNRGTVTSQWIENHNTLPQKSTYTSDIYQVRKQEHLFAVVTGGTTGALIVCVARINDEPLKSGAQVLQA